MHGTVDIVKTQIPPICGFQCCGVTVKGVLVGHPQCDMRIPKTTAHVLIKECVAHQAGNSGKPGIRQGKFSKTIGIWLGDHGAQYRFVCIRIVKYPVFQEHFLRIVV